MARPSADGKQSGKADSKPAPELAARDLDLIEFILREHASPSSDRIYFLTVTPMSEWKEGSQWQSLPESFHKRISDLPIKYGRASDATYGSDHRVRQASTKAKAWMQWVTIKKWLSDTEVQVEEGVWCCPLGGGASTTTYKKRDGKWKVEKVGKCWVS